MRMHKRPWPSQTPRQLRHHHPHHQHLVRGLCQHLYQQPQQHLDRLQQWHWVANTIARCHRPLTVLVANCVKICMLISANYQCFPRKIWLIVTVHRPWMATKMPIWRNWINLANRLFHHSGKSNLFCHHYHTSKIFHTVNVLRTKSKTEPLEPDSFGIPVPCSRTSSLYNHYPANELH